MEKKLNEYLREGETIRWQGQPAEFPLMDNGSRMQILRKWALTVIIAAGVLIAHMQSQMPPRMGLVAVVAACALVVVLTPVVEKSGLMKNRYWITNQRIIHMTKGGMFYYMDLADVDQYEIVTDLSDQETLVLGSAIFASVAAGSAAGGYDDVFEAARQMGKLKDTVYTPIPEHVAVYDKLYQEYKTLHDYFGRGANDVMKRLKKLKAEQSR